MQRDTLVHDLTKGSVSKKLLLFSIPFILSNLLQVIYNLVDMIIVGQYVGSIGLSAVTNGGDITALATLICMGLSSAGQVIISQYVGAGNHVGIQKAIGTMFSFLTGLSLVVMLLGLWSADWLLRVMNVPQEAVAMARDYVIVCMWGMIFIFGYNVVSAVLRGMGDSIRPLVIIAVAAVLNLMLDLLFVGMWNMGVYGAALATVISQGVSYVSALLYLFAKREAFGFDFRLRSFRISYKTLLEILRLGFPLALQFCAVTLSKLFINSYVNTYGVIVSAVNGVGTKIGQSASIVTQGLGMAGTSMIGQCFGARKLERIRKVVYVSLGLGLFFTLTLSALMALYPEEIFGLFNRDPEVMVMAHSYVVIAVLNFNAFALRQPMMALINGIGNGALTMVIGLLDGVVARVGLAVWMGISLDMGIMGFWYGGVLASYVPFVVGGIYFWTGLWMKKKPLVQT